MTSGSDKLTKRLLEAASWQMRLAEGDAEDEAEFALWRVDSANAAAWDRLIAPLELIGDHANDPKMVAYRQAALDDARRMNAALNREVWQWPRRRLLAAIVMILAFSVGGYLWWTAPDDYATAFGERRVVTLSDGSRVSLDSDSEVTVRYSSSARELHLLRGQARFDVAHDVERPFSVLAHSQKVIATGTAFNIDMTQAKVTVTLIQGHVVVVEENAQLALAEALTQPTMRRQYSVELKAGEQITTLPQKPPKIAQVDVQRVVAWTGGQLIFDNEPLSDAVARVNHYATTPIVITDKNVAAMHISGSFNTGDVNGFLDIVTRYLSLREETGVDGRITLRKK